jgi:hypothetical protein
MAEAPLTIPEWFLVIVLASHTNFLPPVQRFEDRQRCEGQLAVQTTVHQLRGQQIVSAHCQRVRMKRPEAAR